LREKRFSFSYADAQGKVWEGVFFWRRPGLRDFLRIEAERARLCEAQLLGPDFEALATMMSRLKIVLREVPAWLLWDELDDLGLLKHLHREVTQLEEAWFRRHESHGGGPDPGAPSGEEAQPGVRAPQVVVPQVRAAADQR
jgi:hypothetical protein